jgi:hypothetical protein
VGDALVRGARVGRLFVSDGYFDFCILVMYECFVSVGFVSDGAESIGATRFKFGIVEPYDCVLFEGYTDQLTWVSKSHVGKGGWIMLFSGSGVHQSFARGVAKPGAWMVGIAYSSTDLALMLWSIVF